MSDDLKATVQAITESVIGLHCLRTDQIQSIIVELENVNHKIESLNRQFDEIWRIINTYDT